MALRCRRMLILNSINKSIRWCSHNANEMFDQKHQFEQLQKDLKKGSRFTIEKDHIIIDRARYAIDSYTNVTRNILNKLGRNLHKTPGNPLSLVKRRIVDFMYKSFPSRTRSPLFSVFDDLSPVVSVDQNYDSLLVPKDHPSRKKTDCYYLNENTLLRAHTSAHQVELIRMGLDNFLVVGDVYRRDTIDKNHFPVFHQLEAVRLSSTVDVFRDDENLGKELPLFESGVRNSHKQESHTMDGVILMEKALKNCLANLTRNLFGEDAEIRWVETTFPFTHPSWELEVLFNGEWMELLGCGIIEQQILKNAGAGDKIGWAFGLGLDRLAMKVYEIPDIRLLWTNDSGFIYQFKHDDPYKKMVFKEISEYPQLINDISFFLPDDGSFSSNDFYEIVRTIGGNTIEQVTLVDEFHHLKTKKWSHCYRITYRSMTKTLTKREAEMIHRRIGDAVTSKLKVMLR